jgi:hypothetical protein
MKALKDILVECFVCKKSVKYNKAHRNAVKRKDTVVVSYMCARCKEKEDAEKK